MTQIVWNTFGERFYETGLDRGVLYVGSSAGVPWNGLTSVDESPSGGSVKSYYIDGVMYLQVPKTEAFQGTITAYQRPAAFGPCEGLTAGVNGLFMTQQRRKPFGMTYRTLTGNDAHAAPHGYKLHILYDVLASPASRRNNTINSSVSLNAYSWDITAKPRVIGVYGRSPHLIIDSLLTPSALLADLENILYGSSEADPRLPSPDEIFNLGFGVLITDHGDGTWSAEGPDEYVYLTDPTTFAIEAPTAEYLDEDTYEVSSF